VNPGIVTKAFGGAKKSRSEAPSDKKRCPMCGEEIQLDAKKCKHCKSMLDGSPTVTGDPIDLGIFLLATPVVGAMFIFGWVGNMRLIDGPMNALALISGLVVVVTAIMSALEIRAAQRVGRASQEAKGPGFWLIGMIMLWIVVYPWYMASRPKYALPRRLLASLLCTALFIVSAAAMNLMVESTQSAIQKSVDDWFKTLE
jgi:hypothetical protein